MNTEEKIEALAKYLEIDPEDIKISQWDENTFVIPDDREYLVVDEEERDRYARDDFDNLWDELGIDSFSEGFKDWILENCADDDFFKDWWREDYQVYTDDIQSESDDTFKNRLVSEMVERGVVSEDEAMSDDFDEDEYKDEFVEALLKGLEGEYASQFVFEFGTDYLVDILKEYPEAMDLDAVYEAMIDEDGYANSLSRYDGREIDLDNDFYAYRQN